ncbi:SDR family oxidoreductase [Gemmatimonas sp.]|jgi:NAD(P)-dependent dehydrogenase (short-subunit alcohol dehydrogenase family)|uniref:SDR family oxidoreductase n=3 Tax=Gemmatimonas sp. TaxID=1962908 RepID=UPI0022C9A9DA|nr:SDR family oxidoreductase [Gemmatimonas sp.]MCA2983041.1 SDR family oxidoreductase [Gemmatimonas sp.]MCA2990035.1 SDR family oxidoreductase [Gemmatimonas sp.]MCZ8010753.1 SDR family oxidoreductase [Gemmatimonas sp.]MCZ8266427.1 SDR family oxidoreductase [Gemmatimonas sp.]
MINTAVLVTGATSGIGKATAIHLASLGYTVFAGAYGASPQDLEDLGAVQSSRGHLRIIDIDVTNGESIQRACSQIENLLPDGWSFALVNNAGVAFGAPLEIERLEKMRLQMEVNYFGVVQVVRCFLPLLRRTHGRIINISSISGKSSMPFNGSYCASKFALEAFADALRLELRPWRIHVSNVLPGDIKTAIWEKALREIDRDTAAWSEDQKRLYPAIPAFMKQQVKGVGGSSPLVVARKVASLLAAKRPPARSYVGERVWFYYLLEKLPTPIRDLLIAIRLP